MKNDSSPAGSRTDKLSGDHIIYQPRQGQRYTTDDMLAAWLAVSALRERSRCPSFFLDLGSGLCSVPMILLWAFPELRGAGIEISPERCRLGHASLVRNGLAERFHLIRGDLREVRLRRRFDLVTSVHGVQSLGSTQSFARAPS